MCRRAELSSCAAGIAPGEFQRLIDIELDEPLIGREPRRGLGLTDG
jgi:hypothetical protein